MKNPFFQYLLVNNRLYYVLSLKSFVAKKETSSPVLEKTIRNLKKKLYLAYAVDCILNTYTGSGTFDIY